MSVIELASAAPAARDIEVITEEILSLKQTAGSAILEIGQRLIEAKQMLPHGEWLHWLEERVEFSERSANRFMRLAREWSNPTTLSDLGASKALQLLALPPAERVTEFGAYCYIKYYVPPTYWGKQAGGQPAQAGGVQPLLSCL